MSTKTKLKIVVIGGKAAGPKAAATLTRRLPDAELTLYQKEKYSSFSTCGLPFFASGDVNSYEQLTFTPYGTPKTPEFYRLSKGFDFIPGVEVISIERDRKIVHAVELDSGNKIEKTYDYLVLATGSIPIIPEFPIADDPRIRTFTKPEDAIHFRQLAEQGKIERAVIIGGGFTGCELAEAAGGMWGIETILIEKENQLLPYVLDREMARIVEREMARQKIDVHLGWEITKIEADSEKIKVRAGDKEDINVDYVFLCVGVQPNSELAEKCGLKIGTTGGIMVDKFLRTSDSSVYAGGDCIESTSHITGKNIYWPMGSLANRHGRIIAENIAGENLEFPDVVGTFVVKVFDINAGAVGITQRDAEKNGLNTKVVWGTFVDKPDYYPETKRITLKVIYSGDDYKLLGLQAVGYGDICRRLDVFSLYLQQNATINDLFKLEHGYSPPYADVLDPLHEMAGIAHAQEKGISFLPPGAEYENVEQWIDVREIEEAAVAHWPLPDEIQKRNYSNFPLNDLRENIGKLDPKKKTVIICGRGSRSYQAALILKNVGFNDVHVIGGGTLAVLS